MDPLVCGKLLTLHRKGNKVDVDALRDRIPILRMPEKAQRWELMGTEARDDGKVFWWMPLVVLEYLEIYSAKKGCERPRRWAQPTWVH